MMSHRSARRSLGELVAGHLDSALREELGRHLQECPSCRREYEEITRIASLLRSESGEPSAERTAEFWQTFADRVDDRIDSSLNPVTRPPDTVLESIRSLAQMRWRAAIAIAGGFAALALLFLLFRGNQKESPAPPGGSTKSLSLSDPSLSRRVNRYLGRSQVLLVGLSNARPGKGTPLATDAEREASRQLAEESRTLKRQPLDLQSSRLMGDLEKIFIELANTDKLHQNQTIDLVRDGIREHNLLFKVRMARARFDSGHGDWGE